MFILPNSSLWHDVYHANLMAAFLVKDQELINHTFTVLNPLKRLITSDARADRVEFFNIMRDWIFDGGAVVSQKMLDYNPNAARYETLFTDKHLGTICVAYGGRIMSQIGHVVKMLQLNPDSRRANIMILDAGDRFVARALEKGETKCEYPCTLGFNFRIRDGRLDMSTSMRSNNYVTTVTQDFYIFTCLQEHIAAMLNVDIGVYYHHTMSGHILPHDTKRAVAILDEYVNNPKQMFNTQWEMIFDTYYDFKKSKELM